MCMHIGHVPNELCHLNIRSNLCHIHYILYMDSVHMTYGANLFMVLPEKTQNALVAHPYLTLMIIANMTSLKGICHLLIVPEGNERP